MSRVLKPSGLIIITDSCDNYWLCKIYDLFLRTFSHSHVKTYNTIECERLLKQENFSAIEVDQYNIDWFWGMMTAKGTKA